ncbi:hypothetical protein CLOM_g9766 [Closterium sp. NIES-68]|nr:hypothetical protein CLOM_g9766 [Closterium sp. NIES-68]GJP76728.1 hypothetical protein CLOP_g7194 [Closterium sp. NIES-67]
MARDRSVSVEPNDDDHVPPPPTAHSSFRNQFREVPANPPPFANARSLPSSSSVPSSSARYIRSTTTPPQRRFKAAQQSPARGSDHSSGGGGGGGGGGSSSPDAQAREVRGKPGPGENGGSRRIEGSEGGSRAQEGAGGGGAQDTAAAAGAGVAREVVFVKGNVAVHPSASSSKKIAGQLRLVKHGADVFLNWIPYEPSSPAGTPTGIARGSLLYSIRSVAVSEMRSIRRHTPPFGWHYIIIVLTSGVAFPPLYFYDGGVKEFLHVLKQHAMLVRSLDDPNVYNVNESFDLLQRSLAQLHLWDPPTTEPSEPPASANFRSVSLPAARRHAAPFRPSAAAGPPSAAAAPGAGDGGRRGAVGPAGYRVGERSASAGGQLGGRALGSVSEEGEEGEEPRLVPRNKLPPSLHALRSATLKRTAAGTRETGGEGGVKEGEGGGARGEKVVGDGGGEEGEQQEYPSEEEMLRMLEAAHELARQQAARKSAEGREGAGEGGSEEQPSEAEMLRILEAANERAMQDAARRRGHQHREQQQRVQRQQPADVAKDISMQVLGGFSAVTRLARGMLAAAPAAVGEAIGGMGGMGGYEGRLLGGRDAEERMPAADAWGGAWGGDREWQEDDEAEVEAEEGEGEGSLSRLSTIKGSAGESTEVGEFELLDDFQDNSSSLVPARPLLPPLSPEEWLGYQDSEGRISEANRDAVLRRVFYSGVQPALRAQVWPRLLGYVPWDASHEEQAALRQQQSTGYKALLQQWQSISEQQARRFTKYRERCSRIDKDVVRTDRHLPFFAGEGNGNLQRLRRILVTYSFYNFDLGYCQGMGDLLAPLMMVVEEEEESFWAFTVFMDAMAPNFHRDQSGMHAQLCALSKLMRLLDPPLYEYLESVDCLNFFFCFRWILVRFKREFEFEGTCRLWEALWSCHLSEHFHLFVAAAVLKRHRRRIMDEQMEFDSLLKFANDLSCHIDLNAALRDAEALCVMSGERGQACMPVPPPPLEEMFEGPETGEEELDD